MVTPRFQGAADIVAVQGDAIPLCRRWSKEARRFRPVVDPRNRSVGVTPGGNLSYAELITKAIESTPMKRMTLSEVYNWIVENVPFFKDKGFGNSSAGWKVGILCQIWLLIFNKSLQITILASGVFRISKQGGANFCWPLVFTQGGGKPCFPIFPIVKKKFAKGPWPNGPLNVPLLALLVYFHYLSTSSFITFYRLAPCLKVGFPGCVTADFSLSVSQAPCLAWSWKPPCYLAHIICYILTEWR